MDSLEQTIEHFSSSFEPASRQVPTGLIIVAAVGLLVILILFA